MFAPFFVFDVGSRKHAGEWVETKRFLGFQTCQKILQNYLKKLLPVSR